MLMSSFVSCGPLTEVGIVWNFPSGIIRKALRDPVTVCKGKGKLSAFQNCTVYLGYIAYKFCIDVKICTHLGRTK